MHKLSEKLAFHKTGFRLLKMAHSIDSAYIPLCLMDIIAEVAAAFVSLILSAGLIDALMAGNYRSAGMYAAEVVLLNLVLGTASHILRKLYKKLDTKCAYAFYTMLRKKALELDYETMEKPEVADKIKFLERTSSMYGTLPTIVNGYRRLVQCVITIITSVSMVIALCLKRPVISSGVMGAAASPAGSIILFAAMMMGIAVASYTAVKEYTRKENEVFNNHTGMELKISYLISQVFTNYKVGKVIRLFDMKKMLISNAENENIKMSKFYSRMCDVSRANVCIFTIINSVLTICAYLLVAVKVLAEAITIGAFTQYVGALSQFGNACTNFIQANTNINRNCTYMKEFLDFMDLKSSHSTGTIPVEKRLDGEYELAFEDVSFHYPGNSEMVLNHVNCKLTMKNKMAVVGRNGAGKTTFIKLLCRLYEPTEGRITLNGVDIRKYDEQEYRDLFGVVFQDFKLFAFPVKENIAAGYEYDDEKLWKVLKQAGAEEVVRNMPLGADTLLYKNKENGVDVSGGEAQKLALARALYKDAPFVILDEPTAALDPLSEAEVYAGFDEMVKDKTSIYISHRMSSCRFCDDIIVFDAGRIVERGDHDSLLSKGGQYANMWNAQAKYYTA